VRRFRRADFAGKERKVERKKRQQYGNEFRQQAVERTNACGNIVGLARELGICRRALYNWRERMEETDSPPGRTRELILRRQIPRLKRLLANKTLEVDFFQTEIEEVSQVSRRC
jgi:transposase-like protein